MPKKPVYVVACSGETEKIYSISGAEVILWAEVGEDGGNFKRKIQKRLIQLELTIIGKVAFDEFEIYSAVAKTAINKVDFVSVLGNIYKETDLNLLTLGTVKTDNVTAFNVAGRTSYPYFEISKISGISAHKQKIERDCFGRTSIVESVELEVSGVKKYVEFKLVPIVGKKDISLLVSVLVNMNV